MTTTQTKDYLFTPQDLMNLLVHYTDGELPLNGEVRQLLVHPAMDRKIALVIASDEWQDETPLFLGYDGLRVRSWTQGQEEQPWLQRNETPTRQ